MDEWIGWIDKEKEQEIARERERETQRERERELQRSGEIDRETDTLIES